jgi:hypothetical protein
MVQVIEKGAEARLFVHCGAREVSRQELTGIPTPKPSGRWHKPVPHIELVQAIEAALREQQLDIVEEHLAVQGQARTSAGKSFDGAAMFGTWLLRARGDLAGFMRAGQSFALGARSANNNASKVQTVAGLKVFVCDNLAFNGDLITMQKKHTLNLRLEHEVKQGVLRYCEHMAKFVTETDKAREVELTDVRAKELLYDVFAQGVLPSRFIGEVHGNYFAPQPEWTDVTQHPRTLWALHNSLTRVMRPVPNDEGRLVEPFTPAQKFKATARLGRLLALLN